MINFNLLNKKQCILKVSYRREEQIKNQKLRYVLNSREYNMKSIVDCGRIEIEVHKNGEYAAIGNIQVDKINCRFNITGVNTYEEYRENGVTNFLFSLVILKLMREYPNEQFTISIKKGAEVKKIEKETGRFIYDRIFDKNNKNVEINEGGAKRVFPLEERECDYSYFELVYNEYKNKILSLEFNFIKLDKTK